MVVFVGRSGAKPERRGAQRSDGTRSSSTAEEEGGRKPKKRGRGRRELVPSDRMVRSSLSPSPLVSSLFLPPSLSLSRRLLKRCKRTWMSTCGGVGASGSMPRSKRRQIRNERKQRATMKRRREKVQAEREPRAEQKSEAERALSSSANHLPCFFAFFSRVFCTLIRQ